jgi:hypothetical protein
MFEVSIVGSWEGHVQRKRQSYPDASLDLFAASPTTSVINRMSVP